ncbi:sigma 54-interacting transcriptional regulator [Clostridium nigeriense]|uniref:sigma-54 interaction domain-containing protein n=1 Tax=Clostridium nigeriense TaxID=1805470 RepID=UPI003D332235
MVTLKDVFTDICNSLYEGFILLDKDENIVLINERAKLLLEDCGEGNEGIKLKENIKKLNFKEQICNGYPEFNSTLKLGENTLIINKIPIHIQGIIKGAIGIFQDSKLQGNFLDTNSSSNILNTIMDTTKECVVVVNKDGIITMMSKCYKEFLECQNPEGKHVEDIIDNTRLPSILESGNIEYGDVQIIKGKEVVAMRVPIKNKEYIIGAIGKIMFRDIGQLALLNNKVSVLKNEVEFYKNELGKERISKYSFDNIIGISKKALEVKRICKLLAKTDSTVLIVGESGTGKELHASAIHNASKRSLGPFIKINCGAIPGSLIESELFGYDEGAFTGAKKGGKKGKFELADGGTIFLDEIGEMPIDMQVRLLRVIQEKEVERVGGNTLKKIDIRIIAATNIDLEEAVEQGRFRRDLYYRLNVMKVEIPPLRERKEDIELLADSLRVKVANKLGLYVEGVSKKAIDILKNYNWPGNIRELENVIERAINLLDSESLTIEPKHLPKSIVKNKYKNTFREERKLSEIIESVEKRSIERCLSETKWNKNKTAKLLGISRASLYKKIEKYNIEQR